MQGEAGCVEGGNISWGWGAGGGVLLWNGGGGAANYIKGGVDSSEYSGGNGGGGRCFSSSFPSSSQFPFQHLEENDYRCHAAEATVPHSPTRTSRRGKETKRLKYTKFDHFQLFGTPVEKCTETPQQQDKTANQSRSSIQNTRIVFPG